VFQCADITFNTTAALLSDDECKNSTGVSGVAIQNAGTTSSATPTGSAAPSQSSGAAVNVKPVVSGSALAGLLGLVIGLL
jgi:hypothetical protein